MADKLKFKIGDIVRVLDRDEIAEVKDISDFQPILFFLKYRESGHIVWHYSNEVQFLANNDLPKTVSPLIVWLNQ